MLGVFACVSERRAVQAPASPICFEVTDWLGPEICDWGAFVAVQGCVEADAVELRYTYTINQPCGPNDEPQLLRYGHRDLAWQGQLSGACVDEVRQRLVPGRLDPEHDSDQFVSLVAGESKQTWNRGGGDWTTLLREFDRAAVQSGGSSEAPRRVEVGGETLELRYEPMICSVTLTHEHHAERSSCTMSLSRFETLVPLDAWTIAEHEPAIWARLRDAARCEDQAAAGR